MDLRKSPTVPDRTMCGNAVVLFGVREGGFLQGTFTDLQLKIPDIPQLEDEVEQVT